MDRIIVLEGAEVVESGSHQELLDMKRRYTSMWPKQSGIDAKAQEQSETQVPGSANDMRNMMVSYYAVMSKTPTGNKY